MDNIKTAPNVDPVTFEVLRHRLWTINDEQGLLAARISGSPAIYEAYDFNAAIMDAEGDTIFVGVYVTMLGSCLDAVVKTVLERFAGRIYDGDMFITNDPWAGAMHMNDILVVTPIFYEDELLAWTGVTMHEMDVGGPVPGSFVVGAQDVFGEAPVIPPLKLMERGEYRQEVEHLFLRNTRTAPLNGLNIRARIVAQQAARKRLLETVERYGKFTFTQVLRAIKQQVVETVRMRLRELPDSVFEHTAYLDHDGNQDELYPIVLTMTKQGDHLIFDFSGTAAQAPGMINCASSGLVGGVMSAVLPMLCYDLPWSTGALANIIEIRSREGTVNNALYPAALSMATISASWMTGNLVNICIGRLFGLSEQYQKEAMACWYPGWHGIVLAGLTQDGKPLAAVIMDSGAGGAGARSDADGLDTGGYLCAISCALANVETNERIYPILTLYRRQRGETAGHGKYRGGMGIEFAITPHKAPIPVTEIVFSTGTTYPAGAGLFGGLPGSLQRHLVVREANIDAVMASGSVPTCPEEIKGTGIEVLPGKGVTVIQPGDVHIAFHAGGGGYGDPLERDISRIREDISWGVLSHETAEQIYGVAFTTTGSLDELATTARRDSVRAQRLGDARSTQAHTDHLSVDSLAHQERIAESFIVRRDFAVPSLFCAKCGYSYGSAEDDWKQNSVMQEVGIETASTLNVYGKLDEFVLREYFCPGCGLMVSADVQRRQEPRRRDWRLLNS
jgi:N-methylhydantoinase B/oxoprolinase/acetone carboxylase alpha subunit